MTDASRLRCYLRLHLAEGVGAILFHRLVEGFGDVESAARAGTHQWRRVDGVGPQKADALAAVTEEQIDEELRSAEKHGAAILCCEDPAYPAPLRPLPGRPPVLYVRGRLQEGDTVALGVVGSRRCTYYGLEQAERFGQLLARAGFTVVSGGARGIDTAAHRGALSVEGRTLAVMGCGLSKTYPPENQALFEQIVADDRGALVSELPMRTAVLAGNFPTRNRIISGLSLGVLLVEAARRSGSLHTAREAIEQNREVFAIPGPVSSPMSQGTNDLIRSGAAGLVQGLDDILEQLGPFGQQVVEAAEKPSLLPFPANLDPLERQLVDALGAEPLSVDELVRRTAGETGKVASAMTMLVLKGLVEQRPGMVFARKRRT